MQVPKNLHSPAETADTGWLQKKVGCKKRLKKEYKIFTSYISIGINIAINIIFIWADTPPLMYIKVAIAYLFIYLSLLENTVKHST